MQGHARQDLEGYPVDAVPVNFVVGVLDEPDAPEIRLDERRDQAEMELAAGTVLARVQEEDPVVHRRRTGDRATHRRCHAFVEAEAGELNRMRRGEYGQVTRGAP